MGDRHRQYILVVMTSNVLKRFQHSGHFLHSVIVAETKPGAMKEKCKIRWKIFVISNTEPDKDSLLKLCMFGKVEGIEMASATSYSPVIQKRSWLVHVLYFTVCNGDWGTDCRRCEHLPLWGAKVGYRKPRSVGVILKDYVGAWPSKGPSEYKGGEGAMVVYLDPNRDNIIYCWPQIWGAANCRLYPHVTLEWHVLPVDKLLSKLRSTHAFHCQAEGGRPVTNLPKFWLRAGCCTCSRSVTPWTVMLGRSATVLRKSWQISSSCFLIALLMTDEWRWSGKSKETCTRLSVFLANPCLPQSQTLGQE